MSAKRLGKIQQILSVPRFNRYLNACGGDFERSEKLYKWNLRVAMAFHPVLGVFEVFFRNKINDTLTSFFGDPDWMINKRSRLPFLMNKQIQDVEAKLVKMGGIVTHSKLVADQPFGFWTNCFEKSVYKHLSGSLIHAFPLLPMGLLRKDISGKLNEIRLMRNRINHNDPICFRFNVVDFSFAEHCHNTIYEVINWTDPDLKRFLKDLDKVQLQINRARKI